MDVTAHRTTVEKRTCWYLEADGKFVTAHDYTSATGEAVPAHSLFSREDDFRLMLFSTEEHAQEAAEKMIQAANLRPGM